MRILIIGGGIAGSATALALHKAGFEIAVYEAHPDSGADIGAFLTLASNGMRALAQFDAARAVAESGTGFPLTGMQIIDAAGAQIADVPLGEYENPLAAFRCLRRADLGAALQAEVRDRGIPIRQGSRLEALTEDKTDAGEARVSARFADGHFAIGDLVVGADGLNSTTRSLIDPAATAPRYAGQRVFYGYTTEATPPSRPARITMIRSDTAAFGYAVSPAGETYWFARVASPAVTAEEIAGTTPQQWRDRLVPILRRDSTPAADIVAATSEQLMVTNAWDLPPGMAWRTGGVLLLGDAAHAASPATGQGASMALEDAVVLAKALRDAPDTATALAAYERLRRPRVERNITVSAQLTAGRTPSPAAGPPSAPPAGTVGSGATQADRAAARVDDEVLQLLDWDTPLPI